MSPPMEETPSTTTGPLILGDFAEDTVQLVEVAMDEALNLAVAESASVHDARVVVLVRQHDIVLA